MKTLYWRKIILKTAPEKLMPGISDPENAISHLIRIQFASRAGLRHHLEQATRRLRAMNEISGRVSVNLDPLPAIDSTTTAEPSESLPAIESTTPQGTLISEKKSIQFGLYGKRWKLIQKYSNGDEVVTSGSTAEDLSRLFRTLLKKISHPRVKISAVARLHTA
jgi:hypothetical protein